MMAASFMIYVIGSVLMHCIIVVSIIHLIIVYSVTAEKWVPIIEVPVDSIKTYLQKKKREGYSILGLEQTANSVPLNQYTFPKRTVSCQLSSFPSIPI